MADDLFDKEQTNYNKLLEMWREEKKKRQKAESELTIIKGIGNTSSEMKALQKNGMKFLPTCMKNWARGIQENNIKKYNHKILGGWLDKAEGVVFENWSIGNFNPNGLQTSCGMDFGFSVDPDTLIEVAIDKTKKKI